MNPQLPVGRAAEGSGAGNGRAPEAIGGAGRPPVGAGKPADGRAPVGKGAKALLPKAGTLPLWPPKGEAPPVATGPAGGATGAEAPAPAPNPPPKPLPDPPPKPPLKPPVGIGKDGAPPKPPAGAETLG